jgi:hypothetical protein
MANESLILQANGNNGRQVGGMLAYRPSLDNGIIPIEFPFTRTTTGMERLSDGLWREAAINLPRRFFDGTKYSYLFEPARTNLVWPSTLQGANWIATHADFSIADIAIEGLLGRSLTVVNTGNGVDFQRGLRRQSQTLTILNGQTFAVSFYCRKTGSNSTFGYYMTGNSEYSAIFNVDTNTRTIGYTSGLTRTGFTIENLGNNIYRCTDIITATLDRTWTSIFMGFNTGINGLVSGMTGEFSQLQFEQGSSATSPIITAGSAVLRAADNSTLTGASALIGQTEGTILFELVNNNTSNNRILMRLNNSLGNVEFDLAFNTLNQLRFDLYNNGAFNANILSTSALPLGRNKFAVRYQSGNYALSLNGAAPITNSNTSKLYNWVISGLLLGFVGAQEISFLGITPTALTNAEMQAYSTL